MESSFKKPDRDKRAWKRTERRIAERIGGRRHGMSGAAVELKGDLSNDVVLVESKSTAKASISLKQAWFEKINQEAIAVHKTPAVAVTFENMDKLADRDWILIPLRYFKELIEVKK